MNQSVRFFYQHGPQCATHCWILSVSVDGDAAQPFASCSESDLPSVLDALARIAQH